MSVAELLVARGAHNIEKAFNGPTKPFGEDITDIYFRTIPNVPPLTQYDERRLGSVIQIYRQVISVLMPQVPKIQGERIPHMEKTEYYINTVLQDMRQSYPDPVFYLFAYVVGQGRLAIAQMMEPNYKLVVREAKKYQAYGTPGFSCGDILGAGVLGLRCAALHFDHTLGFRFSTYVKSWVKQGIIRGFEGDSRLIRLPADVSKDLFKYIQVYYRLRSENREEPSDEKVAQEMRVKMSRLRDIKIIYQTQQTLSLDWVVAHSDDFSDGAGTNMIQGQILMPGEKIDGDFVTEVSYMKHELTEQLFYAMNIADLTETERRVLLLMYGFGKDKPLSRAETGRYCGLTESQTRHLEKRALCKLRSKALLERLKAYRE